MTFPQLVPTFLLITQQLIMFVKEQSKGLETPCTCFTNQKRAFHLLHQNCVSKTKNQTNQTGLLAQAIMNHAHFQTSSRQNPQQMQVVLQQKTHDSYKQRDSKMKRIRDLDITKFQTQINGISHPSILSLKIKIKKC